MQRLLVVGSMLALALAGCQCGGGGGNDGGPDGGPNGCGTLNDSCTGATCCSGLVCLNGSCQTDPNSCGINSINCNGRCVVVINDPANCGACNRACDAGQVCTGGQCTAPAGCPQGTTAC